MPTITFFIRANTLYCRVRLNSTVSEFSTKERILPEEWNQQNQQPIIKNKTRKDFVCMLINGITYKLKSTAMASTSIFTANQLIQEIRKKSIAPILLSEIIEKYIDQCDGAPGTIRNHKIKLQNLKDFEAHNKESYIPEAFSLITAQDYIKWFCKRAKTKNITTANRNVLFYKLCLRWYKRQGNKISSDLMEFEGEKDKLQTPIYLTRDELLKVRSLILSNQYLTRIKDLFLFQCYTGISFADLWSSWEIRQEDYGTIIVGTRAKNNQQYWLPVEDQIVTKVLEKYEFQLPMYHNVVYNRMIKEVVAMCGINKRVTSHTARKTFATMMDANGWSRETVSRMLGHKSIKTTELYYLGESFQRQENEFKQRKKAV